MNTNRRTFLTQIGAGAAGLTLLPWLNGCRTAPIGNSIHLPRSAPEAMGVASPGILAFLDAVAQSKHEFHGFMLVRHGHVVAEAWWAPYGPDINHTLYSMSKSFTSTAVGLAVSEGRLTVEDRVTSFFPKQLPAPVSENLAALRVKDLLTMSVGHAKEPTFEMIKEEDWVKAFLAWPIEHKPGTRFLYNSGATYMCSAIVQQVTGQRILDYLEPRLFQPLGIRGATWDTCPRGINVGGWGLNVTTEALAKFGQLYLQYGKWRGRQVLPASWVAEATTFKIQQPAPAKPSRPAEQNDWLQGYCYQFWRSTHHAYRGDGAFGQYTIVLPEQDAVIAIMSETSNMQGELDLVWEHLLPAMHASALPPDEANAAELTQRSARMALSPLQGRRSTATATRVTDSNYALQPNDLKFTGATFSFSADQGLVSLRTADAEFPIRCGIGKWRYGATDLPGTPPNLVPLPPAPGTKRKIAASGAWKDEDTFEVLVRYYETPHHDVITCRFIGADVEISFMNSIAAMSATPKDKRPVLKGRRAMPAPAKTKHPAKRKNHPLQ